MAYGAQKLLRKTILTANRVDRFKTVSLKVTKIHNHKKTN